jgi:quercetin dioxygenase-like cupin family protein
MTVSVLHQRWADAESETVAAGIQRKFLSGDRLTVARFELKRGGIVPRHAHESEQITQVLRGVLKFAIEGREIVVRGGEVLCIPGWVEHEVEVLEDASVIDVFSPVRQDWIDKTDHYFRR